MGRVKAVGFLCALLVSAFRLFPRFRRRVPIAALHRGLIYKDKTV